MKMEWQLKALTALQKENEELLRECTDALAERNALLNACGEKGVIYMPFPDFKGFFKGLSNLFKRHPLETIPVVHSHWIYVGDDKCICANCFDIFKTDHERFVYCPTCAAMMDHPEVFGGKKGETNV